MKGKIAFVLILAVIIAAGIKGVDIAGYFFNDLSLEETIIDRSTVKSNAVYIASPNEISFNPMELVANKVEGNQVQRDISSEEICELLIQSMSSYYEKAEYSSPLTLDMYYSFKFSGDKYIYLDKFKYLNPENELRYIDCIIDLNDYSIIYINFYSDAKYDLKSDEIDSGIIKLREYSSIFMNNLSSLETTFEVIYHADAEYNAPLPIYTIDELRDQYKARFALFDKNYESTNYKSSIEYFWTRSLIPSQVFFYNHVINYSESYETTVYSTIKLIEELYYCTYKNEYVAYNGRIYQTINLDGNSNFTDTIIVIYNISEDVIEGFYAPPKN